MNFWQSPRSNRIFARLSKRNRAALFSILGLLALGGAAAMFGLPMPKTISGAAHTVGKPVWGAQKELMGAVYGAYASLENKQVLIAENVALREEMSSLRRQAFEAELLAHENKHLKKLLGRRPGHEKEILGVVLRGVDTAPQDMLVIDAGEEEGVREGSLVTADGGVAIGSVRKALRHTSTVVLFSSPGEKTAVFIGSTSTVPAVAEGRGGGMFKAEVPRDSRITEGNAVTLSTIRGEIFAKVERVRSDPVASFSEVLFKNPVNTATLRFVVVHPDVEWEPGITPELSNDNADAEKESALE